MSTTPNSVENTSIRMSRRIEKGWMNERNRMSDLYLNGVNEFMEFAKANTNGLTTCPCPCRKCRNKKRLAFEEVEHHLIVNAIDPSYRLWALHGEKPYDLLTEHPTITICEEKAVEEDGRDIRMGSFVDHDYEIYERDVADRGHTEDFDETYVPEPDLGKRYSDYKKKAEEKLCPTCDGSETTLSGSETTLSGSETTLSAIIELHNLKNNFGRSGTSSTSCQTEGTSKKDAKKKMPLSFTNVGVVVGENAAKWKSRVGHFVRSYVPIDITDFRRTPQNFLDDVWNALKEEFDFGSVDQKIIRESLELGYSQRFRTMKGTLRNEILRKAASVQEAIAACPIGIDPGHWENFVKREMKPEVIAANLKNKMNRQKGSIGHTLGRRTYAQNNYIRQQKHPKKKICRTEDWLRGHEKPDGTPLDSAKEKYLLVKEAANKRRNTSTCEGNSSTHMDLDSDELAEVFGRDTRGRVRGVGSNISRKQLLQSVVTSSIVEEKNSSAYRDVKADVTELKTTISRMEDMMATMYRRQCASSCSSSMNKQVSALSPTGYKVKLCDREGTEVARGHVVIDSTSGMCHGRRVLPGERKVYVEEVLIGNALVYDGPQDGNSILEGFIGGGYVIWLEARLEKV